MNQFYSSRGNILPFSLDIKQHFSISEYLENEILISELWTFDMLKLWENPLKNIVDCYLNLKFDVCKSVGTKLLSVS